MDTALAAYLPQDRYYALATDGQLPEQALGAALFADIAGFTPLTEAFDRALGPRRGAEALVHQFNQIYDALIAHLERFGASVISFAGDSLTCWFDESLVPGQSSVALVDTPDMPAEGQGTNDNGQRTALRAVACALALQDAMRQFAAIALPDGSTTPLALKVAIASGSARRLVVGDPNIQLIDTLAGATLARMAAGEHLATKGEIVIDAPTAQALGGAIHVSEWRADGDTDERFAVLAGLQISDFRFQIEAVSGQSAIDNLQSEIARPWLLPAVYERHQAGLGDFLTELRPVVALFLRFGEFDYDGDPAAGAKLDTFIRRVQQTLARYDGTLLQLTIGDKGSYLYATFGAPTAHEDDPARAAHAALDLLALPDELDFLAPLQIGLSRGVMRVGACGGATRRCYAVIGDEVNLAARLMSQAAPGDALLSGRIQAALASEFELEPLPPIPIKGMPEPLPIFRLAGRRTRAVRLSEPAYALPMVGRQAELALVAQKLDLALQGKGQVVGIRAEAGMGKSRLLAEVIRLARRRGLRGYGGACQSYGTNTPYLVWGPIWRALFDLDPDWPARKQIRMLESAVADLAPERRDALPLLGPLLDLPLPENDLTEKLEPQYRKSALEALLIECLQAAARGGRGWVGAAVRAGGLTLDRRALARSPGSCRARERRSAGADRGGLPPARAAAPAISPRRGTGALHAPGAGAADGCGGGAGHPRQAGATLARA